jgi:hypothetical protein
MRTVVVPKKTKLYWSGKETVLTKLVCAADTKEEDEVIAHHFKMFLDLQGRRVKEGLAVDPKDDVITFNNSTDTLPLWMP